jgi:hypothetical protein
MSQSTPESKAKWRRKHRTWSAELLPEEFERLKAIQSGLSNYQFLKKIIERENEK